MVTTATAAAVAAAAAALAAAVAADSGLLSAWRRYSLRRWYERDVCVRMACSGKCMALATSRHSCSLVTSSRQGDVTLHVSTIAITIERVFFGKKAGKKRKEKKKKRENK